MRYEMSQSVSRHFTFCNLHADKIPCDAYAKSEIDGAVLKEISPIILLNNPPPLAKSVRKNSVSRCRENRRENEAFPRADLSLWLTEFFACVT